jgi:hypothetical protein
MSGKKVCSRGGQRLAFNARRKIALREYTQANRLTNAYLKLKRWIP